MVSIRVLTGINGWHMEKQRQGANLNPKVVPLIALMFGTLDALYVETRKLPLPLVPSGANKNKPKDKPDVFTLGLFFEGQHYVTLRSILALMGDLIYVLKNLGGVKNEPELGKFIKPLQQEASKFEAARHFFTHMDDPLRNYAEHAIPVPHTLDCGVEFTANATNNIYLIWESKNNTLYFSYEHKPCEVVIDRAAFDEIFNQARQLYDAIINNPISRGTGSFPTGAQVYPP
jgi:hypothetical protein